MPPLLSSPTLLAIYKYYILVQYFTFMNPRKRSWRVFCSAGSLLLSGPTPRDMDRRLARGSQRSIPAWSCSHCLCLLVMWCDVM